VERPGAYYEATVLADVPPDAPGYREELFGPVASLFPVAGAAAAIALAWWYAQTPDRTEP
jgi:succinate-semialdehyde dehydrogenase/glutarate-semialdehyde dehydrogenase